MFTLKEQLKASGPFAASVALFITLRILNSKGIYENTILLGISYILMGLTLYYSNIISGKILKQKGYNIGSLPIYASGVLSGIWFVEAMKCFFI